MVLLYVPSFVAASVIHEISIRTFQSKIRYFFFVALKLISQFVMCVELFETVGYTLR